MPTELHLLKDLELEEVSLVDFGANSDANIMLYKRGNFKTEYGRQFPISDYSYAPDPTKPSTWKLRLTADPGGGANARIVGAVIAALGPTGFRGRKVQIPTKDLPKVKARVLAAWKKLHPDAKELPASLTKVSTGDALSLLNLYKFGKTGGTDMPLSQEELEKRLETLEEETTTLKAANVDLTKRAEDAEAGVKKAEEESAKMKEEMEKGENPFAKPKDGDDEEDEKEKEAKKRAALPASVVKQMDDQADRIQKQDDKIAKMEEDADRATFVTKAKSTYADLPCTSDELGEALRSISKVAPGSLEVVEKALTAGNEAIKKAMNEVGAGGEADGSGDTAYAALVSKATDIMKRDGVTKETAFVKASDENPDLWTKHREYKRSAH